MSKEVNSQTWLIKVKNYLIGVQKCLLVIADNKWFSIVQLNKVNNYLIRVQ